MAIKVELTEMAARELLRQWYERVNQLYGEAADLETNIAVVEAQLNGKLLQPAAITAETRQVPALPASEPHKRSKGENMRTIVSYLQSIAPRGATAAELHKHTHVPLSSVKLVLKKPAFYKGPDGLWRIKP
jgi:hypothetical protein